MSKASVLCICYLSDRKGIQSEKRVCLFSTLLTGWTSGPKTFAAIVPISFFWGAQAKLMFYQNWPVKTKIVSSNNSSVELIVNGRF